MYDAGFYATVRDGAQRSAAVVVPLVLGLLPYAVSLKRKVIDVGCGEGWWAHTFAANGCDVTGVDSPYPGEHPLGERFVAADLTRCALAATLGPFDLAVSLEVGEHLPASAADAYVNGLCELSTVVLFSAAIPGQGGTGHINEQWPSYWVDRFQANGYTVSGALRWLIWDNDEVENWYRQNLLIAAVAPQDYPELFDTPTAPPWAVVHPVLYRARTGRG
jgi:SAM-dependent methyltransferase